MINIFRNKSVQNTAIYTIMGFFQKAISFFMIPIYTAFLSPAEFGIVGLIISIGSIYILIFTFALDEAAARFFFINRNNVLLRRKVLGSIVLFSLIISVFGGFVIFVFNDFFYFQFIDNIPRTFILLSVILVITSPIFSIYKKVLRIREKAKEYSLIMFIYSMVQIGLSLLFIIKLELGAFGLLLAISMTSLLMFVYCILIIYRNIELVLSKKTISEVLKYSTPIVPHTLSGWGLLSFTIVSMGKFLGSSAVGIFNAISLLGVIINVLSNSFFNAYQPWIYNKLEEGIKGNAEIIRISKVLGIFSIIAGGFLSLFAKEIIEIFINERYHSGIIISPIVIFTSIVLFLGSMFTFVLYYHENSTKYIAFSTIIGAIVNVLLSLYLIPRFGIMGGAISLAVANILVSIFKQWFVTRIFKVNAIFLDLFIIAAIIAGVSLVLINQEVVLSFRAIIFIGFVGLIYLLYYKTINYYLNVLFK